MDLDTLIRRADPARHLEVPATDVAAALATARASTLDQRPKRSTARLVALTVAATVLTGGVALAAGAVSGVIDLGGGQHAVTVSHPPVPTDPQHPYVYQVTGLPAHRDGTGPVYIESSQPLATIATGQVDGTVLAQARHQCAKSASVHTVATTGGQHATVWVFDAGCHPTRH